MKKIYEHLEKDGSIVLVKHRKLTEVPVPLYAVINRKEMHDASGEHKEVPHAMHPFYFFHSIKNAAGGIEYTT